MTHFAGSLINVNSYLLKFGNILSMSIRATRPESDFSGIVDLINQVEPEPIALAQLQQWTVR